MSLFHSRQLEGQSSGSTLPGAVALIGGLGRIAAVVVAIVAIVLLTHPSNYNTWGVIRIVSLFSAAAAGWVLFSLFSRGQKATYWALLVLVALSLLRSLAVWFFPAQTPWLRWNETQTQILFSGIFAALILLALLLPKTRHHFYYTR